MKTPRPRPSHRAAAGFAGFLVLAAVLAACGGTAAAPSVARATAAPTTEPTASPTPAPTSGANADRDAGTLRLHVHRVRLPGHAAGRVPDGAGAPAVGRPGADRLVWPVHRQGEPSRKHPLLRLRSADRPGARRLRGADPGADGRLARVPRDARQRHGPHARRVAGSAPPDDVPRLLRPEAHGGPGRPGARREHDRPARHRGRGVEALRGARRRDDLARRADAPARRRSRSAGGGEPPADRRIGPTERQNIVAHQGVRSDAKSASARRRAPAVSSSTRPARARSESRKAPR